MTTFKFHKKSSKFQKESSNLQQQKLQQNNHKFAKFLFKKKKF